MVPFWGVLPRGSHQRSTRVTFSTSRREWEFLLFNLAHRDETRIFWHLISGFEKRSKKILLQSQASRRDRDLLSSFSGFETRSRILLIWSQFSRREWEFQVANLPWMTWTAALVIFLLHDLHFAFPLGSLSKYCQLRLWFFPGELSMVTDKDKN